MYIWFQGEHFPWMFIEHVSLSSCELPELCTFLRNTIVICHTYCKYFPTLLLFIFMVFESTQYRNTTRSVDISMLLFKCQISGENQEPFKLLEGFFFIMNSK